MSLSKLLNGLGVMKMENKKSRILIEAEKYVERQLSRLDEQDRLHWYASQLEQAYIAGAEAESARWAKFNYDEMMKNRLVTSPASAIPLAPKVAAL